jgi:hypothetical protein
MGGRERSNVMDPVRHNTRSPPSTWEPLHSWNICNMGDTWDLELCACSQARISCATGKSTHTTAGRPHDTWH